MYNSEFYQLLDRLTAVVESVDKVTEAVKAGGGGGSGDLQIIEEKLDTLLGNDELFDQALDTLLENDVQTQSSLNTLTENVNTCLNKEQDILDKIIEINANLALISTDMRLVKDAAKAAKKSADEAKAAIDAAGKNIIDAKDAAEAASTDIHNAAQDIKDAKSAAELASQAAQDARSSVENATLQLDETKQAAENAEAAAKDSKTAIVAAAQNIIDAKTAATAAKTSADAAKDAAIDAQAATVDILNTTLRIEQFLTITDADKMTTLLRQTFEVYHAIYDDYSQQVVVDGIQTKVGQILELLQSSSIGLEAIKLEGSSAAVAGNAAASEAIKVYKMFAGDVDPFVMGLEAKIDNTWKAVCGYDTNNITDYKLGILDYVKLVKDALDSNQYGLMALKVGMGSAENSAADAAVAAENAQGEMAELAKMFNGTVSPLTRGLKAIIEDMHAYITGSDTKDGIYEMVNYVHDEMKGDGGEDKSLRYYVCLTSEAIANSNSGLPKIRGVVNEILGTVNDPDLGVAKIAYAVMGTDTTQGMEEQLQQVWTSIKGSTSPFAFGIEDFTKMTFNYIAGSADVGTGLYDYIQQIRRYIQSSDGEGGIVEYVKSIKSGTNSISDQMGLVYKSIFGTSGDNPTPGTEEMLEDIYINYIGSDATVPANVDVRTLINSILNKLNNDLFGLDIIAQNVRNTLTSAKTIQTDIEGDSDPQHLVTGIRYYVSHAVSVLDNSTNGLAAIRTFAESASSESSQIMAKLKENFDDDPMDPENPGMITRLKGLLTSEGSIYGIIANGGYGLQALWTLITGVQSTLTTIRHDIEGDDSPDHTVIGLRKYAKDTLDKIDNADYGLIATATAAVESLSQILNLHQKIGNPSTIQNESVTSLLKEILAKFSSPTDGFKAAIDLIKKIVKS